MRDGEKEREWAENEGSDGGRKKGRGEEREGNREKRREVVEKEEGEEVSE